MKMWYLGIYLTVTIPLIASALPKSHSPFFPEENYMLSLGVCSTSRDVTNMHPPEGTIKFWQDENLTLALTMSDFHYIVQVRNNSTPLSEAVYVDVQAAIPGDVVESAVCADLNRDGETDFVVTLWLHGNGLGASFYKRLIALSSLEGYRFWVVPTMTPTEEDFVSFGQLEPIVMVTTDWVNTGTSTDPPHSYLVYDLWTFRDGEIISANGVDTRFSKWVWMTRTENHMPANSLTNELKRRLRSDFIGPTEATP